MNNILAISNTALLVVNIGIVAYGLSLATRHFRYNRTWSYIERYNSNDLIKPRAAVASLLCMIESLPRDRAIEKMGELLKSSDPEEIEKCVLIDTYVNLFTELGVAHRARAVDYVALEAISGLVVRSWSGLEPYITAVRMKVSPNQIHIAFEELNRDVLRLELHKVKATRGGGLVEIPTGVSGLHTERLGKIRRCAHNPALEADQESPLRSLPWPLSSAERR